MQYLAIESLIFHVCFFVSLQINFMEAQLLILFFQSEENQTNRPPSRGLPLQIYNGFNKNTRAV